MLTKEELYLVKSSLKLEYFSNISRDTSLEKDIMLGSMLGKRQQGNE